jgi:hypothetical protein
MRDRLALQRLAGQANGPSAQSERRWGDYFTSGSTLPTRPRIGSPPRKPHSPEDHLQGSLWVAGLNLPFEAHDGRMLVFGFDPAQLEERLQRSRHGKRHDLIWQARRLDDTLSIIALKRWSNGRKRGQQFLG